MNCTAARFMVEALKAEEGEVGNRDAYLAAFEAMKCPDDPRGPITLDGWDYPVQNVDIRKVERMTGRLRNTTIYTYPSVSQYWHDSRDEYLKQPVNSRDYPPCRFCS